MSVCTPDRRFWMTVLDTPSSRANSRTDLLSSAMRASTSSESKNSLYSFLNISRKLGFFIQRSTVETGFLLFGIILTRFHSLLIVLHALDGPCFLHWRQLV